MLSLPSLTSIGRAAARALSATRRSLSTRRPTRTRSSRRGLCGLQPRFESLEDRALLSITVGTDKQDYSPGETVQISAVGLQAGAQVEFQVVHDAGTPGIPGGAGHAPWTVTDGGPGDLDGKVNGAIATQWYVNPDDSADATFHLTAKDLTTGEIATAVFYDTLASQFEGNDANATTTTSHDWDQVYNDVQNSTDTSAAHGALAFTPDLVNSTSDNIFTGGGSKDINPISSWAWTSGKPQGKDDIANVGVVGYIDPTTQHHFVYMMMDRYDNAGNSTIGIWLFENPISIGPGGTFTGSHTVGDLLMVADFNGGGASTIVFYQWTGSGLSAPITPPASAATAICNSNTITTPWTFVDKSGTPNNGHLAGEFFEAAVDLDAIFPTGNNCFAGFLGETRSSNSTTSTLSDFAFGSVNICNPKYAIAKTVTSITNPDNSPGGSFVDQAGDVIHYQVTLTNTGNENLHNVVVSDPLVANLTKVSGDTVDPGVLDVGETWTYTGTYTVTQADINSNGTVEVGNLFAGAIDNTVTATNTELPTPQSAVTHTTLVYNPAMALQKIANVSSVTAAGQVITYTYNLTNTGNVTLTGITLVDNNYTPANPADDFNPTYVSGDTNSNGKLDLGETWTYTAMHTVTQAEMDAGLPLINVATGDSNQTPPVTSSQTVNVIQQPGLALNKVPNVATVSAAGQTITYTYTLTNVGNVKLTGITLSDDNYTPANPGDDFAPTYVSGDVNNNGALDLTETWTYTSQHTVTQTEMDAGAPLHNIATADSAQTAPVTHDATVNIMQQPGMNLVKVANKPVASAAGQVITYTYTLSNIGNVTLTGITLVDDNYTPGNPGDDFTPTYVSGDTNNDGKLQLTETWTYTASHTVTQAEIDAGVPLHNIATADSIQTSPVSDDATVNIVQHPGMNLLKVANVASVNAAGQVITYTYTLSNTGNVTLTGISLIDDNYTPANPGDDFAPTLVSGDTNNNAKLDVGETWTYTALHTVTQAEMDAGLPLHNVATADSAQTSPISTDETVTIQQKPGMDLNKVPNITTVTAAGQLITYTYTLTNTGNVTLTGITLVDDNYTPGNPGDDFAPTYVSGDTNNDGKLQLTETWTYTASHIVTQAEMDAGVPLVNVATADSNETAPVQHSATVDILQRPNLQVHKSANVATVTAAGQAITYTYLVHNHGNVTLTGITLFDNNYTPGNPGDDFAPTYVSGDTNNDGKLQTTEAWVYTSSHIVTQAEMDAGLPLVNVATVDSDQTPPNTASATVSILQQPGMDLHKEPNVTTVTAAGQVITYTYTLTNTGNVTLTGITLIDDNYTPANPADDFTPTYVSGDTNNDGKLQMTETWIYTSSHVVTQAEMDAGLPLHNVATADSAQTAPVQHSATVNVVQQPGMALQKKANVAAVTAAGQVITYTYTLTNIGDVTLTSITLVDNNYTPGNPGDDFSPTYVSGDTNNDGKLQVTETWTYTAQHTVTQTEMNAGVPLVNIATADSAQTAPVMASESVAVQQVPGITVTKDANLSSVTHAGQVITYFYAVSTTGNTSLTGVTLVDDNYTPAIPGDDFNPTYVGGDVNNNNALDPGETWHYTATHTVTQTEMNVGVPLINVATANSNQIGPVTASEIVNIVQQPSIALQKVANVASVNAAGQVITYTYTVQNTGNISLTGVTLVDDNYTPGNPGDDFNPTYVSGDVNNNNALDVGETWIYTSQHTVTQAEIDAGATLVNVATVDTNQTPPVTHQEEVAVQQQPGMNLVKVSNVPIVNAAGQIITYTYTLTNIGNETLTGITLIDDHYTPGNPADDFVPTYVSGDTNNDGKLDLTETWIYTAAHVVTQAEIDAGTPLRNIATADSAQTSPVTDDAIVNIVQQPSIALEKVANVASVNAAGQVITYTYTVTNTGNMTLTGITLIDDNFTPANSGDDFAPTYVSGDTNNDGKLDLTETWIYTATHVVTQAEIDAGLPLVNVATADSNQTPPVSQEEIVAIQQQPGIAVNKEANVTTVNAAGQVITYTYAVTNTGNVTLTGISLTDDNYTPANPADDFAPTYVSGDTNNDGKLDLTETWIYTSTHTVTQSEMDTGVPLTNVATVDSNQTPPAEHSETVNIEQRPVLQVHKSANLTTATAAGQVITYTYLVHNHGNVTLTGITLIDDNHTPGNPADDFAPTYVSGDTNNDGKLQVGEAWVYTSSHIVTQAEMDAGLPLINTATVDSDQTPPDTDSAIVNVLQQPGFALQKVANVTTVTAAGQAITYTYVVTNTGNVSVSGLTLTDDNFTPGNPGDDFHPTYVSGDVNNDNQLGVGETWFFVATHIVTQAEINAGLPLTNVVIATSNNVPPQTATETVDIQQNPAISLSKVADVTNVTAVGDVINYTYQVTNPGNVSLTGVTLIDDNYTPANPADDFHPTFVGGDTNSNGALDPGETWTYVAAHVVTQADLNGQVPLVNVATADSNQTPPTTDSASVAVPPTIPGGEGGGQNIFVLGPDKSPNVPQNVQVVNTTTNTVVASFPAYESNFLGGTRVAMADFNGDGIQDIVTAPGRGRAPEIRFFDLSGNPLPGFSSFLAYNSTYMGGVQIAVADVNGDGRPDLITIPSDGPAEVRVFLNQYPAMPGFTGVPYKSFMAFPSSFIGGGVVAAADVGQIVGGNFVNAPDGKAEIFVGSGPGMLATVEVFDVSGAPTLVQTINPFATTLPGFNGGVFLATGRINADLIPDLIAGAGPGGLSNVEVWTWDLGTSTLNRLGGFVAFTGPSNDAPVRVAGLDSNGDGIVDQILTVQGPGGTSNEVNDFQITSVSPFTVVQLPPYTGHLGPWFIATGLIDPPAPEPDSLAVGFGGTVGSWLWSEPGNWKPLHNITPVWMVSGDLDGNGKSDMVVNFGAPFGIWIHWDTGAWQFLRSISSTTAVMADLNGDGRSELILSTPDAGVAGVWAYYQVTNTWRGLTGWQAEAFAVGDFDGNGKQDVATDFGANGLWFFKNDATWSYIHNFNPKWMAAGDFDGNGKSDLAISFTASNVIWIRHDTGVWQGLNNIASSAAVAADVNGDGLAELVVNITDPSAAGVWAFTPTTSVWRCITGWKAENLTTADVDANGAKDVAVDFGSNGLWVWKNGAAWQWVHSLNPVIVANAHYGQALMADLSSSPLDTTSFVTYADLSPIVAEAKRRWELALGNSVDSVLNDVTFEIADLSSGQLGLTVGRHVWLDRNAAGYGWFIDPTPSDDSEFAPGAAAPQRMDLLSAVMHEMGHALGLPDIDSSISNLMDARLEPGVRRI